MTCVAVSSTRREARAGTIRTETPSPTAQPSPTSRTRSTAKPNGPKVDPLMLNNRMMAVIGATRKPADERQGRDSDNQGGCARQPVLVRDCERDGAAVYGAEHRSDEAVQRSLERAADVGLSDDQGRDHGPEPLRERKGLGQCESGQAGHRHPKGLHQLRSMAKWQPPAHQRFGPCRRSLPNLSPMPL